MSKTRELARSYTNDKIDVLTTLEHTFYVDAVSGDDSNSGASSAPFKTIKRAVDGVPSSGLGHIYLVGTSTHVVENTIFLNKKDARIFSASGRSSLKFAVLSNTVQGFQLSYGSSIKLGNIDVSIDPTNIDNSVSMGIFNCAFIRVPDAVMGNHNVTLLSTSVTYPVGLPSAITGNKAALTLTLHTVDFIGDFPGGYVNHVGDASLVNIYAATVPAGKILTNLG